MSNESETTSERRLAENEVIFRKLNEQLQKDIDETNRIADEDGQPEYKIITKPDDESLYFLCECSDENCVKRVRINLHNYTNIHKNRARFVIIPGHQTFEIERIVSNHEPEYLVVEKRVEPPEDVTKLHPTSVDNT